MRFSPTGSREFRPSRRRNAGFADSTVPMRFTVMMPSPAVSMMAARCMALSLARERAATTLAIKGTICQRNTHAPTATSPIMKQQQHVQLPAQIGIERFQRPGERHHQRRALRSDRRPRRNARRSDRCPASRPLCRGTRASTRAEYRCRPRAVGRNAAGVPARCKQRID